MKAEEVKKVSWLCPECKGHLRDGQVLHGPDHHRTPLFCSAACADKFMADVQK